MKRIRIRSGRCGIQRKETNESRTDALAYLGLYRHDSAPTSAHATPTRAKVRTMPPFGDWSLFTTYIHIFEAMRSRSSSRPYLPCTSASSLHPPIVVRRRRQSFPIVHKHRRIPSRPPFLIRISIYERRINRNRNRIHLPLHHLHFATERIPLPFATCQQLAVPIVSTHTLVYLHARTRNDLKQACERCWVVLRLDSWYGALYCPLAPRVRANSAHTGHKIFYTPRSRCNWRCSAEVG